VAPTTSDYDAFISYSHAIDGRFARSLQTGLHRFAKPWYRLRALRVFRDEASLSANPALWTSITQALDATRWFLLLASPEAARSEWVGKEVQYWCAHKPKDHLLIVLTGGAISWDDAAADFDWTRTDALPPTMASVLTEEPRFVDVSWASQATDVSLRNSRFSEAVADIAAPLHGRPKDEMLGEDVRQHRRTRRVAGAAIVTLSILFVAAIVAAFIARAQTNRAEREARIALSRQLAAEATTTPGDRLDLALLLAAQAFDLQQTTQARGALLSVLARSPRLAGYLPGTKGSTVVNLDPSGTRLIAGTEGGALSLWDVERLQRMHALELRDRGEITAGAFSPDGRYVAAGNAAGAVGIWVVENGESVDRLSVGSRISAIAFNEDSRSIAAADEEGTITIWDLGTDEPAQVLPSDRAFFSTLAFAGGTLIAGSGQGDMTTWDLSDPGQATSEHVGGGQPLASAYSPDMSLFAGAPLGIRTPYVFDVPSGSFLYEDNLTGPTVNVDVMAFTPDGETLGTAGEGRVVLWSIDEGTAHSEQLIGAPTTRERGAIALGPRGRRVVAGGSDGVAVWDLSGHALRRSLTVSDTRPLDEVPNVARGAASAAFNNDGTLLAWTVMTDTGALEVVVWSFEEQRELLRVEAEKAVGFSPDSTLFAASGFAGERFTVVDLKTGRETETERLPWRVARTPSDEVATTPWVVEDRGLGASIAFDGTLTLWDTSRRQPLGRIDVPGAFDFSALVFDEQGKQLAVTTAGGVMSIIDTDVRSWHRKACRFAARTLTDEEWSVYIAPSEATRTCA
jgi:WD40 repeat protein